MAMPARPLGHTDCCDFCLGCHGLLCVVGRRIGTPRHLRRCALCRQGLEDEKHLVSECIALVPVRLRFQHLFQCSCTLSSFMNQAGQRDVMYFVTDCLQRSEGVIVARFSPYTSLWLRFDLILLPAHWSPVGRP
jgi:hypothetical protein